MELLVLGDEDNTQTRLGHRKFEGLKVRGLFVTLTFEGGNLDRGAIRLYNIALISFKRSCRPLKVSSSM